MDGAMEFASGVSNFEAGVDPIFPPAAILLAISNQLAPIDESSQEYYALAYAVTHARFESQRYTSLLENSRSGLAYVKNRILKAIYDRTLQNALDAYNPTIAGVNGSDSAKHRIGLDSPIKIPKDKIVERIFEVWLRCSDLMKTMSNSRGAIYLNIIHPNPYHSKKSMTEAERKILDLPESSPIRQNSSAGYALFEERADLLRSRGIVSASALFDGTTNTIYADSTGHFGKLGETLMANFVADQVASRLGPPHND
jgi:hypothetical protein